MLQDVAYPGGKAGAGVYQRIISLMPPHRVYIEPFLGAGAVMVRKRPARVNIGVDLVASPFVALGDLQGFLESSARAAIRAASADLDGSGDKRSRTFIVRGCGIEFLRAFPWRGDELVYCDPPYLMSTRSGRRLYEHEMDEGHHRSLLSTIQALPCMVMISGYWSEMYGQALRGWRSINYDAMTRGGHTAREWLWFNFEPPAELHDYRYLGRDFRERERIKRKKARWTARLRRMPDLERQALLAAIAETGSGQGPSPDLVVSAAIVRNGVEVLG